MAQRWAIRRTVYHSAWSYRGLGMEILFVAVWLVTSWIAWRAGFVAGMDCMEGIVAERNAPNATTGGK
jgi:hypothetical protein